MRGTAERGTEGDDDEAAMRGVDDDEAGRSKSERNLIDCKTTSRFQISGSGAVVTMTRDTWASVVNNDDGDLIHVYHFILLVHRGNYHIFE